MVEKENHDVAADPQGQNCTPPPDEVALCFSGGGIRSATFNLGVLQGLANNGWLRRVNVLSTVSGGGYIGAWFVALIARRRQAMIIDHGNRFRALHADFRNRSLVASPDDNGERQRQLDELRGKLIDLRREAGISPDQWSDEKRTLEDDLLALSDHATLTAPHLVIDELSEREPDASRLPGEIHQESAEAPTSPPVASVGAATPTPTKRAIDWLRAYSNYLTPTWGFSGDALALVALYLRNLAIHWAMLLPVMFAVLLVPRVVHLIVLNPNNLEEYLLCAIAASAVLMGAFATNGPPAPGELREARTNLVLHGLCFVVPTLVFSIAFTALANIKSPAIFPLLKDASTGLDLGVVLWFALLGGALYLAGSATTLVFRIVSWLITSKNSESKESEESRNRTRQNVKRWLPRFPVRALLSPLTGAVAGALCGLAFQLAQSQPLSKELQTALMPLLFVLSVWLASVLRVAIATRVSSEPAREWWARASGGALTGVIGWVILALLVLWLPAAVLELSILRTGWAAGSAGLGGLLFAAATAAIGYWSKNGADVSKEVSRWYEKLGNRAIDIAAVLTLIGASLVLNLLIGFGLAALSVSTQASHASKAPTDRKVFACASSATGTINDMAISSQSAVPCALGKLILTDMLARDYAKEDLRRARGHYLACCAPNDSIQSTDSAHAGCPIAGHPAGDQLEPRDASIPIVDSICFPPSEYKGERGVANTAKEGATKAVNASEVNLIHLEAQLPIPLQMALDYRRGLENENLAIVLLVAALGLLVVATLMAGLAGADTYSLQAMYANRLTRAYLGASRNDRSLADPFADFDGGDDLPLHQLQGIRPELVINAALNRTRAEKQTLAWQQRKASAFAMTPEHCGAPAEQRCADSPQYKIDGEAITLGKAIAISGAAVSPNMGYHSSPAVAAVLSLFNLRLGQWLPSPLEQSPPRRMGPLGVLSALFNELRSSVSGSGSFVYVSDGGHFENLGVYAMLQQQRALIVAVDAGTDPHYTFSDVENLLRKARVDLGADIRIHKVKCCIEMIREGRLRYLHAAIRYASGKKGTLILLKPVIGGDEPYDVAGYNETVRKQGSAFPQQSTADQFFDEDQFESYRVLGRHTVDMVFGDGSTVPPPPNVTKARPRAGVGPTGAVIHEKAESTAATVSGVLGATTEAAKSLGSMSHAALLASAITLTGVVGVSGVVSLKDSTVSIDEKSLARLSEITGSVDLADNVIKFDEDTLQALRGVAGIGTVTLNPDQAAAALTEGLANVDWEKIANSEKLGTQLQRLETAVSQMTLKVAQADGKTFNIKYGSDAQPPDLKRSIDELKELSNGLVSVSTSLGTSSNAMAKSITTLNVAVGQFKRAVEGGNPASILKAVSGVRDALGVLNTTLKDNVASELTQIRKEVQDISPRNTVRGGQ